MKSDIWNIPTFATPGYTRSRTQRVTTDGRCNKSTISRHIKNVFEEGELQPDSTVAFFATVQTEGKRKVELFQRNKSTISRHIKKCVWRGRTKPWTGSCKKCNYHSTWCNWRQGANTNHTVPNHTVPVTLLHRGGLSPCATSTLAKLLPGCFSVYPRCIIWIAFAMIVKRPILITAIMLMKAT